MRLLLRLILIAFLAFASGAFVLVKQNPEADFWGELRERQSAGLAALRKENPGEGVLLFTGGSSCAFSVDPGIVRAETGMPAWNLGASAWSGPKYYVHETFVSARAGDVVVLGIEPNFLTEPGLLEPTPLGLALAWNAGDPDAAAGGTSFAGALTPRQQVGLLRPGARHLVTWFAKRVTGSEPYYYSMADLRSGGRLETRRAHPVGEGDPFVLPGTLTPEARRFLGDVAAMARGKNVDVVYTMPWYFTAPESVGGNRETRRHLVAEIAEIMPVLDDPSLGIRTEAEFFSDTNFHLTAAGSEDRSRFLGKVIDRWRIGTR